MTRAPSELAPDAQDALVLSFGPFLLRLPQRELSRGDELVQLGSRAADILVALLRRAGELVSREDLIGSVWGDTTVEENTLRVHMYALRKALGDGKDDARYIVNEAGRGYRFVATVSRVGVPLSSAPAPPHRRPYQLPAALTRIVGREDVVDGLAALIPERRFLTIAGPGGVGKTTVALAIAHKFVADQGLREACFIDFAPVLDPLLASSTVASALGVPVSSEDVVPALRAALADREVLLLFDNCEHLVEAIAVLVERLLQEAPRLCVLATSREPLRAEGEWVHRLATLQLPPLAESLTVDEAMAFPSVRLFVERAVALRDTFVLSDDNVAAVRDICVRLDGIPLALEFAAARIDMMDVAAIAARLDDRFTLLTKGRRTSLPRQQTLLAALDWSYELLDPQSQIVLQRLSVFRSRFDMAAAIAIAGGDGIDEIAALNATMDLVSKSLVITETGDRETRYRLLDTTRLYGISRLLEGPDAEAVRRRHAVYYSTVLGSVTPTSGGSLSYDRIAFNSRHIDDIRGAFDWAFSRDGDVALGVDLLIATTDLWFHMSLPNEFLGLAWKAILAVEASDLNGSAQHVKLLSAYSVALWHARGPVPAMREAAARALSLANALGDPALRKRSAWDMWHTTLLVGDYAESLDVLEELAAMPDGANEAFSPEVTTRSRAVSLAFMGEQPRVRELIEAQVLADRPRVRATYASSVQIDGHILALTLRARTLWLQGRTKEALDCALECAAEVSMLDHDLSICHGCALGIIPVAIWSGEIAVAAKYAPILRARASGRGLGYWEKWADGYEASLAGTDTSPDGATLTQLEFFVSIGSTSALTRLLRARREDVPTWVQPELLRLKANQIAVTDSDAARQMRERALAIANDQGAVAWKLKIINDLN